MGIWPARVPLSLALLTPRAGCLVRMGGSRTEPDPCSSVRWQVHLLEQRREARVAAQAVQERVELEVGEPRIVQFGCASQPCEGAIGFSAPRVHLDDLIRGHFSVRPGEDAVERAL